MGDAPAIERSGLPDLSKAAGHKYDHGHALILAGRTGRGGAARLAARAALRIGAGAVTVAPPPSALLENAIALPDAVMTRGLRDGGVLREVLVDRRIDALCLGPGMGTGEREAGLLDAALDPQGRKAPALVLDADALTVLSSNGALRAKLRDRCVLTPHMGEFRRLAPDLAERLATDDRFSKVDAAREAAARLGAVMLLKGPDTVIARPDGRAAIHSAAGDRAAPWLATAGAGDVLSGMICGLLARGLDPFEAACAAAWLHVECALAFGPGLTADDLPKALPGVLTRPEGAAG
ncbi:MAG: NAD(P)H-hydrate dehydratase [Hasllibacter sp.]